MENILLDDFILDKEENFSSTERDDLRQLLLEANLKVTKNRLLSLPKILFEFWT